MLEFLSERVRTEFHKLPIDVQSEWEASAKRYAAKGFTLRMTDIFQDGKILELTVRIDEKFKPRN